MVLLLLLGDMSLVPRILSPKRILGGIRCFGFVVSYTMHILVLA